MPELDYTTAVNALDPYLYWKLDETSTSSGSGRTAVDSSGNNRTGQYNTNVGHRATSRSRDRGAPDRHPEPAVTLNQPNSCINTTSTRRSTAPAARHRDRLVPDDRLQPRWQAAGFETPRTGSAQAVNGGTYDRTSTWTGPGKVVRRVRGRD